MFMKVYVVTDLEGVDCVVLPRQVGLSGTEDPMYQKAKHLLTQEVNAAVEGAFSAGAEQVLVLDGHGANSAYNLVVEELSEKAHYVLGSPWDKYLPQFDRTIDAVFIVGQHPMAGTRNGVLDHTMSSETWVNAYINNVKVGEIGFIAYYAGYYGVPVVLVTGDHAACEEAKTLIGPEVEVAPVKFGLSRTSARCLSPAKARSLIREKAEAALQNPKSVRPLQTSSPVEVRIELLNTAAAKGFLSRKSSKLIDERIVVFTGDSIAQVYEFMFG